MRGDMWLHFFRPTVVQLRWLNLHWIQAVRIQDTQGSVSEHRQMPGLSESTERTTPRLQLPEQNEGTTKWAKPTWWHAHDDAPSQSPQK